MIVPLDVDGVFTVLYVEVTVDMLNVVLVEMLVVDVLRLLVIILVALLVMVVVVDVVVVPGANKTRFYTQVEIDASKSELTRLHMFECMKN